MTALYVHIPFCRKKCFYCSFVVAISQRHHMGQYVDSLCAEIDERAPQRLASIYLGGGTPSQLSAKDFHRFAEFLRRRFVLDPGCEWTVEINPEDADLEKFRIYHDAGVNRLSIGAQTFHDLYLRQLGRSHDASRIMTAYSLARCAGFENISVDIMYGFPGQTNDEIEADLGIVTDFGCDHVSLYSLTVEPGSKFYRQGVAPGPDDICAEQYVFVKDYLIKHGFGHYEVSNFSKPCRESRHNLNYWKGGNYLGAGVGAHSHQDGHRWWNISGVRDYIGQLSRGGSVRDGEEFLSPEQRLIEAVVFGLRIMDGVCLKGLKARYGCDFQERQKETINRFCRDGLLSLEGDRLRVTDKGLLVLDDLSAALV